MFPVLNTIQRWQQMFDAQEKERKENRGRRISLNVAKAQHFVRSMKTKVKEEKGLSAKNSPSEFDKSDFQPRASLRSSKEKLHRRALSEKVEKRNTSYDVKALNAENMALRDQLVLLREELEDKENEISYLKNELQKEIEHNTVEHAQRELELYNQERQLNLLEQQLRQQHDDLNIQSEKLFLERDVLARNRVEVREMMSMLQNEGCVRADHNAKMLQYEVMRRVLADTEKMLRNSSKTQQLMQAAWYEKCTTLEKRLRNIRFLYHQARRIAESNGKKHPKYGYNLAEERQSLAPHNVNILASGDADREKKFQRIK